MSGCQEKYIALSSGSFLDKPQEIKGHRLHQTLFTQAEKGTAGLNMECCLAFAYS